MLGFVRFPAPTTAPGTASLTHRISKVPGLLHAWYIIAKFPDDAYDYRSVPQDAEGGRVTYVYVQSDGRQVQQPPRPQAQPQYKQQQPPPPPQQHGGMNYGATNSNNSAEAGGSSQAGGRAPPTYAEAVQGDHKIQTRD